MSNNFGVAVKVCCVSKVPCVGPSKWGKGFIREEVSVSVKTFRKLVPSNGRVVSRPFRCGVQKSGVKCKKVCKGPVQPVKCKVMFRGPTVKF